MKRHKFTDSFTLLSLSSISFIINFFIIFLFKIAVNDNMRFISTQFVINYTTLPILFIFFSVFFYKTNVKNKKKSFVLVRCFFVDLLILLSFLLLHYLFPNTIYDNTFLTLVVLFTFLLEGFYFTLHFIIKKTYYFDKAKEYIYKENPLIVSSNIQPEQKKDYNAVSKIISKTIETVGQPICDWICSKVDISSSNTFLLKSYQTYTIEVLPPNYNAIINLESVNNFIRINKYFETANEKLPFGGKLIGIAETLENRRDVILKGYWKPLNYCMLFIDFIIHRVFPKLLFTKHIYFFFSKGKNRALSKAEVLGRLYSCGFEADKVDYIDNLLVFSVIKVKAPDFNMHPTYGPLIALRRIGKNNEIVKVYKLRTMYPYSEYIQKYLIQENGYDQENKTGKIANDYRITTWGRWARKLWLDEVPQIINVIKGDLGIVGVRPLSLARFETLPEDVKTDRVKFKPGCIPPYVALLMQDENKNIDAERIYLNSKKKYPFWTDFTYFFKAVWNIVSGKIRSA